MDKPPRKKRRGPFRKSGPGRQSRGRSNPPGPPRRDATLNLQKIGKNEFAFVAPICACDRQEDLAEVYQMIEGGEQEIARDELLYLVADCRGFLAAHVLLAQLALEENDLKLARGHFGFAYENGIETLTPAFRGRLPASHADNLEFFLAGRGLARCLIALGKSAEGREVLEQLAKLDPQDADTHCMMIELAAQEKSPLRPK